MQSNTSTATAVAVSQTLTTAELDRARLYLEQTKLETLGAIKNLSEAQWKYKPSADRWSIQENIDHVIAVQEMVLGPFREKLANAPIESAHPDYKHIDDIIIFQFPNRLTKFPSPFAPGADLAHSTALERLSANYSRLNEYLETVTDLRNHSIESPPLKGISNGAYEKMDGYQWILAVAGHTERHTKQVLEVIADSAFPS